MKLYRDEIAKICHEIVEDGYRSGIISDVEMREFEKNCFVQEPEITSQPARNSERKEHITSPTPRV